MVRRARVVRTKPLVVEDGREHVVLALAVDRVVPVVARDARVDELEALLELERDADVVREEALRETSEERARARRDARAERDRKKERAVRARSGRL